MNMPPKDFQAVPNCPDLERMLGYFCIPEIETENCKRKLLPLFDYATLALDQEKSSKHFVEDLQPQIMNELKYIRKRAEQLLSAINTLSPEAAKWLDIFANSGERFGFDCDKNFRLDCIRAISEISDTGEQGKTISAYTTALSNLTAAAGTSAIAFGKARGTRRNPAAAHGNSASDLFVLAICAIAWRHGGRVTYTHANLTGTLLDFLNEAGKYLPKNFLPPPSRIKELHQIFRRNAKKMNKLK